MKYPIVFQAEMIGFGECLVSLARGSPECNDAPLAAKSNLGRSGTVLIPETSTSLLCFVSSLALRSFDPRNPRGSSRRVLLHTKLNL